MAVVENNSVIRIEEEADRDKEERSACLYVVCISGEKSSHSLTLLYRTELCRIFVLTLGATSGFVGHHTLIGLYSQLQPTT